MAEESDGAERTGAWSRFARFLKSERGRETLALLLLLAGVTIYFALFTSLSIYRISNFRGQGVDLAIFDQVVWKLSKFKGAYSTIRGMNLFGDHMQPILFLLVPVYWLKANAYGLLAVQTAALSLGALPIYLIARKRLDSRWLALFLSAAYLFYPALQNMNIFDFHPETLGLCFLLFAFLAADRRRFAWFYVMCACAAICKEDMALAVVLLGLVVYIKYDKRAGAVVAWAALAYFLVSVLVIVPRLGPEGFQYAGRLKQFGNSTFDAAKNMIIHPRNTFNVVATRENLRYVFDLLGPVAFLSVLSPLFLLPALPAFAINIISDFQPQHTIANHYTAAIVPFVFIALIFSVRKIQVWSRGAFRQKRVTAAIAFVIILSAIAGCMYLGPGPLSTRWNRAAYMSDAAVEDMRAALKRVPQKASVSAQIHMIAHVSEREQVYMFPAPFIDYVDPLYLRSLDADTRKYMFPVVYRRMERGADRSKYPVPVIDYVALYRGTSKWPLQQKDDDIAGAREYDAFVKRLVDTGAYRVIYETPGGAMILKRSAAR